MRYLHLLAVFATGLVGLCLWSPEGGAAQTVLPPSHQDTKAPVQGRPANRLTEVVIIPGPLRSFLRMAAISQKISPDDVLPLLARNVYMQGYQEGKPTEFLILLDRYLQQAKELQILAGSSNTIRVKTCDDAGTLIQILGYRLQGCGEKNIILRTASAERAFLTIDSGFPLTGLEEALQKGVPFSYSYPSSRVPVVLREIDWVTLSVGRKGAAGNLVDVLVRDPAIARLYWAISKDDAETQVSLQRSPGLLKLLPFAAVLDFYGSQICIRSGHVVLPGGAPAEAAWKDLVGASSESPGDFVIHLVSKDNGWLAEYFDVLSRVSPAQQAHFTQSPRLKRLYEAFRAPDPEARATSSVFRRAPDLLVLFTRIDWESNGDPHVPGDLAAWKTVLEQKTDSKMVRTWGKRARSWSQAEQLLEAMAAFSRLETDRGPLQLYLTLSEIDGQRPTEKHLSADTVRLLASRFSQFDNWYPVFSEFPELSDQSIVRFMNLAEAIGGIPNQTLRGNALGSFQANIGLWQILARQGEIPKAELDISWQKVIDPFVKISTSVQLFDATRASLEGLLLAASGRTDISQEEFVELLAGPPQESADGMRIRLELAARLRSVLEDQRLVSFDTLFALSDGLHQMAQGAPANPNMLSLASELREFEMPRAIFTNSEKVSWAPRVYSSHHAELQVRTDLTKVINTPALRTRLEGARGQLAPFLRDTVVGLNYAYYEPPGAQLLHHNSLFVRSHDFSGLSVLENERYWQSPQLMGMGMAAGGGAYLMGSLADLPYALAMTEQDFIAPENVQALIWKDLVPDLLVSATIPRWWSVNPNELHAVALYQRSGEELLTASVRDPQLREKVISVLSLRMAPQRLEQLEQALLHAEDMTALLPRLMPADTFYLTAEFRRKYPGEAASLGPAYQELEDLCRRYPSDSSSERLSKDFGVPHPILARNYSPDLLNVKPFPAFGGDSSRLFGESWESSNLYWARLADEKGYLPVMLNRLVPELTHRMAAKIFATEIEDWPALQRAMRETGEEFRQGNTPLLPITHTAARAASNDGEDRR